MTQPGYYGDGGGLWLQVSPTGTKSWIFRFTLSGKAREMGLGALHTVSLADARQKALECRQLLLDGRDPLEVRGIARTTNLQVKLNTPTFDQCAEAYISAHRASWKNEKHIKQWSATITTYASPVLGNVPVNAVDTTQVMAVLAPIWKTKTETATRLRGRIEKVLDWATVSGHRQGDNPARWKGHLDHLLAKPSKVAKVEHHPALPWKDVHAFILELRKQQGIAARALEFLILTAARSGEVRGATWDEIDLEAAIWVIPASRMKAGKEHRVPLSPASVRLLKSIARIGDLVFSGMGDKPLSDMTLAAVLRRMQRTDITVHGFRSTFRDWCAEATNYPREVCEQALAHSLPDKVEAAYFRSDLFGKRVHLMVAWADYCLSDGR